MSVAYGVSTFAPVVCAMYTCECGRRAVRHGSRCGTPPAGWEHRPHGRHLCAACCAKRAERAQPRP